MDQPVSVQTTGGVAVLTVDQPPNNALSAAVRAALSRALAHVAQDPVVRAVVLAARGRGFASGQDPDDAEDAAAEPGLAALADRVEACPKPVIAALHGPVAGPGLELALAAHYRIADRRATFGFPAVRLGLTPGAGGTQRLPRLIGAEHAVDLLTSGRMVSAGDAEAMHLVDAVAKGPLPDFVLGWIREGLADGLAPRPTRALETGLQPVDHHLEVVKSVRAALGGGKSNARGAVLDCLEASLLLPYEAAIEKEKAAYEDCLSAPQSRALRHMARAEQRTQTPPLERPAKPRKIDRIGVVGAGRIGRGVVAACLDAGYPVTLIEHDIERLEESVEAVIDLYDQEIEAKRMDELTRDRRIGLLNGTTDPATLAGADLVIEAVPDDPAVKRRVFATLDAVMKRDAILASTTSTLDLDALAAATGRARQVVGLHFFPPAYRMRAVEVVVGAAATDPVVATAFDLVRRLGKIPVASAVSSGYVALRMAAAFVDSALFLMARGAAVERIDAALSRYGFAMGPLMLADAIGIDMLRTIERGPGSATAVLAEDVFGRMMKAGRIGRRAGRGFYRYGAKTPTPDPKIAALFGRLPRGATPPSDEEILRRTLAGLANRGAQLVQDGVAQRPSDIDVLMVQVFGYPRTRGGPMMAAELVGLLRVRRDLDGFAADAPELWQPAGLWTDLLNRGEGFEAVNG